jgi:hypothetical protein
LEGVRERDRSGATRGCRLRRLKPPELRLLAPAELPSGPPSLGPLSAELPAVPRSLGSKCLLRMLAPAEIPAASPDFGLSDVGDCAGGMAMLSLLNRPTIKFPSLNQEPY